MEESRVIEPQKGYQTMMLASPADIAIGGGAAGCFVGETLVLTPSGHKKIRDVHRGEMVLSVSLTSKQSQFKEVLRAFRHGGASETKEMCVFELNSGLIIKCTVDHEFYFEGNWIRAKELTERVLELHSRDEQKIHNINTGKDMEAREISLQEISRTYIYECNEYVYDLCVENNHNYCITKENILVHNSGKTFSLLLDPVRDIHIPDFDSVIFRRTTPQITTAGGLWDESKKLYPHLNAGPNETKLHWTFPSGSRIKFSHLEHEKNVVNWQGSQIAHIGFDELTHFQKDTFFYFLSRNRTTCGVRPRVRATCNPDPDSWLFDLIKWWIGEDGFPIPERQGVLRYFSKHGNDIIWADTVEDCIKKSEYFLNELVEKSKKEAKNFIKSMTFVGGSVYENKILLDSNPEYLANLAAQSEDIRLQLLEGNWKVSVSPDDVYQYHAFRDAFNNTFVEAGEKRIVVDVAMSGEDKLIVGMFEGYRWEDIMVIPKSTGKDVVDSIISFQNKHKIGNSKVIFDSDGVGAFLGGHENGFISGARPFHNGAKQVDIGDDRHFFNLKTQCYIYSGERSNRSEYFISPKVASTMYDDHSTVKQRLMSERKAIKLRSKSDEESERLISKKEMKQKYLDGTSPDLFDVLMMNDFFELEPTRSIGRSSLI